jgi:hypothetical protein
MSRTASPSSPQPYCSYPGMGAPRLPKNQQPSELKPQIAPQYVMTPVDIGQFGDVNFVVRSGLGIWQPPDQHLRLPLVTRLRPCCSHPRPPHATLRGDPSMASGPPIAALTSAMNR